MTWTHGATIYMQCEGGNYLAENQTCHVCGRKSHQNCGKPLEDPRNIKIRQLQAEIADKNSLIVDLQNALKSYREREKVQGWSDM